MPNGDKHLSPEEREVKKIISETKEAVSKLEADISKLSDRGTLQLNLKPSGALISNPQQTKKDIEKLQNLIEDVKSNAMKNIDKTLEALPEDRKKHYKEMVRNGLYIEPEKEVSFANRYNQGLSALRYFNKEAAKEEKSLSRFITPQRNEGEKEKS